MSSHEAKFFSITKAKLKYKFPSDTVRKILARYRMKSCFREMQIQLKLEKHLRHIKEENKLLKTQNISQPGDPNEFRFYTKPVLKAKQMHQKLEMETSVRQLPESVSYSKNYYDLKIHAIREEIINSIVTGETNKEKMKIYKNFRSYDLEEEDHLFYGSSNQGSNNSENSDGNEKGPDGEEEEEEDLPPIITKAQFNPFKSIKLERLKGITPRKITYRKNKQVLNTNADNKEELMKKVVKGESKWRSESK